MKFKRRHNRNGRQYEIGDAWNGDVDSGRFLYHRDVLEPDGSPGDHLITGPRVKPTAWHGDGTTDSVATSSPEAGDSPPNAGEQE